MTIKDIARECGCGLGTVSRVLNNHPDVSDKMRKRVLAVVEKHHFVSNQSAKQLRAQDSKVIEILVKGTSNPMLTAVVEHIQKRLELLPYTTNVIVVDEYENEAQVAFLSCQRHKPLGILFVGGSPDSFAEDFARVPVPCVVITGPANSEDAPLLSSVCIDDVAGARCMAEYLLEKGHVHIGVIGGDRDGSRMSRMRFEGFCRALEARGIAFDERHYVTVRYSEAAGAHAAEHLMETFPSLTALYALADTLAMGAIRQLADMGYKVPDDVSVCGFDGLHITQYFVPRITTIRQPVTDLAEEGLNALLRVIEWNDPHRTKIVPFELVEGESVRSIVPR